MMMDRGNLSGLARLLVACLIGLGPLTLAGSYFLLGTTPNDANPGAAFYLGVAIVITPFFIIAAVAFYLSNR
jgi:hypothetical protein